MSTIAIRALHTILALLFAGALVLQIGLIVSLINGSDVEDGTVPLTALRICTLIGLAAGQVIAVCLWKLTGMARRGTVFTDDAFRYVNGVIVALVGAAAVWLAVTAINAPGQRDDPGVTLIMGGVAVAILGVALLVYVLRAVLAQAVDRDTEATRLRSELDEVI